MDRPLRYLKGHGTGNDFVVLPDPDGALALTDAQVAALCDRRTGLGADGVLRVVRTAAVPEAADQADGAEWFMDYRNADGSAAQMCGNGVRVYARYLFDAGLAEPGDLRLATRDGLKGVRPEGTDLTVDMGPATVGDPVLVDGRRACAVDLGNPHAVLEVADVDALGVLAPDRTDLNVEYVQRVGPGRLRMRVHERGVGETASCGTGACAAVVAVTAADGGPRDVPVAVQVPGGTLRVTWCADGRALLTGPAVLVAEGVVRPELWAQ